MLSFHVLGMASRRDQHAGPAIRRLLLDPHARERQRSAGLLCEALDPQRLALPRAAGERDVQVRGDARFGAPRGGDGEAAHEVDERGGEGAVENCMGAQSGFPGDWQADKARYWIWS